MSVLSRPFPQTRSSIMSRFRPDSSCVLWLPGQDDPQSSVIRDKSGNGNHGTINGAIWTRTAKGLWVLSFDGVDDYVDCGNDPSLNFGTGDFTVEFWGNVSDDGHLVYALWKKVDQTYWHCMYDTNNMGISIKDGTNLRNANVAHGGLFGSWHHLTYVFRHGDTITFYKDSVPLGTIDISNVTGSLDNAGTLKISTPAVNDRMITGQIDEVRIYNRALSVLESRDHFRNERCFYGV